MLWYSKTLEVKREGNQKQVTLLSLLSTASAETDADEETSFM